MAEMHFAHLSSPDMQAMRYHLKVDIKYISWTSAKPGCDVFLAMWLRQSAPSSALFPSDRSTTEGRLPTSW